MSWVATAIVGGSLISGFLGNKGAKDAASISAGASDRAAAVQEKAYETTRADLAPYRDAGVPALQRLMYLVGLRSPSATPTSASMAAPTREQSTANPDDPEFGSLMKNFSLKDFYADPGYQFRQSEGEKALQRGALARGLDASSGTLRKLMTFNSGLASQEYGNAYSRFNADKANKFNLLSYLAGGGQNAAAMTGTAGTNAAAGSAQAIMAGGAAGANAALTGASSWNNAIQGGLSNYMYQQRFDQMMSRMPVFSPVMTANPSWSG